MTLIIKLSLIFSLYLSSLQGKKLVAKKALRNDQANSDCWMDVQAPEHFKIMQEIDDTAGDVPRTFDDNARQVGFDGVMLEALLESIGVAGRAVVNSDIKMTMIPAGLNIGGEGMIVLADSILFFHRMKLRNHTYFRVLGLRNDLENMTLNAKFALHDLHLFGSYERVGINMELPSNLNFRPTYGTLELLLKDAYFQFEGRYHILKDRLRIDIARGILSVGKVLLSYKGFNNTECGSEVELSLQTVVDFVDRLKTNLGKWLRDYFNDYLVNVDLSRFGQVEKLQQYDKEKTSALNEYVDTVLTKIRNKLLNLGSKSDGLVKVPSFNFSCYDGATIVLTNGTLKGLDSIHRRSISTGVQLSEKVRKVDTIVGFSDLKLTYEYNIKLGPSHPRMKGLFILAADGITAHMGLTLIQVTTIFELYFDFIDHDFLEPRTLTIKGPANRQIANFKHKLEVEIFTTMSNVLIHNIRMMGSLDRCVPILFTQKNVLLHEKETHNQNDESSAGGDDHENHVQDNEENILMEFQQDDEPEALADEEGDIKFLPEIPGVLDVDEDSPSKIVNDDLALQALRNRSTTKSTKGKLKKVIKTIGRTSKPLRNNKSKPVTKTKV